MSLVARLYLLVALALLPILGIEVHNQLRLRQDREAQVHEEAVRLAHFVASEMERLLDGARILLTSIARAPGVRKRDAAACEEILEQLGRELLQYTAIGAVNPDGTSLCAQGETPPGGVTRTGRPWFEAGLASGKFHVGEYAWGQGNGQGMLPITLPLADIRGQPAGLVGLSLDLGWLNRHFAARGLPRGASVDIADRSGTLIVRAPDQQGVGGPMPEDLRWMLSAPQAATLADVGPDGVERIVGFVPPHATASGAFLVSVQLSPEEALAGVREATQRGVLLVLLSVALAAAAAWLAGRIFILPPVSALLQAADRLRGGDFTARSRIDGSSTEFGRLGAAFDAMAQSLERHEQEMSGTLTALQASEERFRQFGENSQDVLWIYDCRSRRLEYLSPAFDEIWGIAHEDLLTGRASWLATVHPEDRPLVESIKRRLIAGERVASDYRVVRPDGGIRWIRGSGFPIHDAGGALIRVGGICRDITDWRRIEAEREASLRERELMVREINHRVKNNLQVVISLLRLQANRNPDPKLRDEFEEACGRVNTITEIHARLFDGEEVGGLDFGAYLRQLCDRLDASLLRTQPMDVTIRVEAEPIQIDLDRAVPLGLIANELVTNAIKHGLADTEGGLVQVHFAREGDLYRLTIEDNGPGLGEGAGAALTQGLGMQLVNGFVRRLQGRLGLESGQGLRATVEFPATKPRAAARS